MRCRGGTWGPAGTYSAPARARCRSWVECAESDTGAADQPSVNARRGRRRPRCAGRGGAVRDARVRTRPGPGPVPRCGYRAPTRCGRAQQVDHGMPCSRSKTVAAPGDIHGAGGWRGAACAGYQSWIMSSRAVRESCQGSTRARSTRCNETVPSGSGAVPRSARPECKVALPLSQGRFTSWKGCFTFLAWQSRSSRTM